MTGPGRKQQLDHTAGKKNQDKDWEWEKEKGEAKQSV